MKASSASASRFRKASKISSAERIFHVASRADWQAALAEGLYRPPGLENEGFIHLAFESQLAGVLERYYQGRTDLVILEIAGAPLGSALRVESACPPDGRPAGSEQFPHLYAALRVEHVVNIRPYP